MDDELDDALEAEARQKQTSKAALIRTCVAAHYRGLPSVADDPLTALLGVSDDEPVDDIDAVIYGP
jgi:hypothetical protein